MPTSKVFSVAAYYDRSLLYAQVKHLPEDAPHPLSTCHWPRENIELLEQYRDWFLGGGVSTLVTNTYHILMAGHVFGLTLRPHSELDVDRDLDCALDQELPQFLEENSPLFALGTRFWRREQDLSV